MLDLIFAHAKKGSFFEVRILERATKSIAQRKFFASPTAAETFAVQNAETGFDAYFGVAPRATNKAASGKEEQISHLTAIWADFDARDGEWRHFPLPPTLVLDSGTGFHLFWILTTPCEDTKQAERVMKMMSRKFEGVDKGCWASTHFLRVTGTSNYKYNPPKPVRLVDSSGPRYSIDDLESMVRLSTATIAKIINGPDEGDDRSAMDWHVVSSLVSAGMSDEAIEDIYKNWPIGAKYLEKGPRYLQTSIENARKQAQETEENTPQIKLKKAKKKKKESEDPIPGMEPPSGVDPEDDKKEAQTLEDLELIEFEAGLWDLKGKTALKVTDWTFDVTGMITPDDSNVGNTVTSECFVCTVFAGGRQWNNVMFPSDCFSSDNTFRKHLRRITWSFSGASKHVVAIQRMMRSKWEDGGRVTRLTTRMVGLQYLQGRYLFAQTNGVIFDALTGTLVEDVIFTNEDTKSTLPPVGYNFGTVSKLTTDKIETTFEHLVGMRHKHTTMPLLGWLVASYFKHRLADLDATLRFPLMLVTGTQGSGKTTMLRLFKRVVGISEGFEGVAELSSSTTRFVLNSALSGTTTVPVHLTEFRETNFTRADLSQTLRHAYDGSSDPRGRANQTTMNYRFTAPVLIDGEERFSDSALRERTIILGLQKHELSDNESFRVHASALTDCPTEAIASALLLFATREVDLIECASDAMNLLRNCTKTYRSLIPDRVYNNCMVITLGLVVVRDFLRSKGCKVPFSLETELFTYLEQAISENVDLLTGHSTLAVDTFVVTIAHQIAAMQAGSAPQSSFQYKVTFSPEHGYEMVSFNLASAFNWWTREVAARHTQRMQIMDEKSIQRMLVGERHLSQGGYVVDAKRLVSKTGALQRMYTIDPKTAIAQGLDIPDNYPEEGAASIDMSAASLPTPKIKLVSKKDKETT